MSRRLAWPLLLSCLAACQCRPSGPVDPVELGLRVQPLELDFGRVLEGASARRALTLTSATRAEIAVALSTDAPFSAPASTVVPGGSDVQVEVTFKAGSTLAEGVLRLTVGDRTAEVKLRGTGVRPPDCRPSAECIVSTYSLEEDRCVETGAADDAPCDPASVCLEQGRCRGGQCLGIARRCDDNDKCTDDACAMDVGCVHTPHVCPRPAMACRVATCDPTGGCGEANAPDATLCGSQDCVEVNFCVSGQCVQQPTPDGLPCAPPIACLPEATCQSQRCERVLEGDWTPDWSARLEGEPTGELAASGATLFFSSCVDAGTLDAGLADAGASDAGDPDAGEVDAGRPLVCGLTSYTGTGFERFVYPYEDEAPRAVWAVSAAGVLVVRDGGLELRSPMTGALRFSLEEVPERSRLVVARERVFLWRDGGVLAWRDGGLDEVAPLGGPVALARGNALFAWNPDAGLLTRLVFLSDGGLERSEHSLAGVETPTLSVSGDSVTLGATGRLHTQSDAGFVRFDWADAGAERVLEDWTLSSDTATTAFFERDGGAWTFARVFDAASGESLWSAPLTTPVSPGRLVLTTLIDAPRGTFTALVRSETMQGPRTSFALYADGERKGLCRLPELSGAVERAVVSSSALVVTARRPDGGLVLESYDLAELSVSRTGWPQAQGVGGTRSDRP